MMTSTEYETIIKNAAAENDDLRDRIRTLEERLEESHNAGGSQPEGVVSNPYCVGCYRLRMIVACGLGVLLALVLLGTLELHPMAIKHLAVSITGKPGDAQRIEAALAILTALAPPLANFADWKWKLYKLSHPDVFGAIDNLRRALKEGQKTHE